MNDFKTIGIDLAYKSGKLIRDNFSIGMKKEWKKDNSPLTATDKAINKIVIDTIKTYFPDHGILGEEESSFTEKDDYIWVCDPIDGTIPFSHGIPISTFSLALTHRGEVELGIIYDPFMDRIFVAEKGKGAFLNGKRIEVSNASDMKSSVASASSWPEGLYDTKEVENALEQQGARLLTLACYTYGGALVACGEFIAAVYSGRNPWDVAAIKIIVEEAGGICSDMQGKNQRYDRLINGFIASNRKVYPKLLEIISQKALKNS